MDITEDMVIDFFGCFCRNMNSNGDGVCQEIGKKLGFEEEAVIIIRETLTDWRWLREIAQDTYTITRTGLRRAKKHKLISDQEFQKRWKEIFDR